MSTHTSGYAPVNGIQMYYEIHGEGSPLVLIHGGGSTIETSFSNLLPDLSRSFKVIAMDLQAHGRTNDRNAPETFQQDADDVAALLQHLGIPKADFLGFSNGGSTTMQIAIRHPQLVDKMVVISGAYRREGLMPGLFEGLAGATLKDMPAFLREAYLKVAPDEAGLQTMFEKDRDRMLHFEDWPVEQLRSINVSALIMASDLDVITREHTVDIARQIPGARLAILPGTHGVLIGEGEGRRDASIAIAIIKDFLK